MKAGEPAVTPKRVSIVITCFNQAHYLAEAVESVLAQTRLPEEIIIIDDGSTDDTAAVAARFDAVDYVFQENRGLAAARNAGLRRATGDHILFLDSDDILRRRAIERCLPTFATQSDVAFVYGGFWYVDSKRGFLSESIPMLQKDRFAALLTGNHIAMHGTVMYKTTILRLAGGFDETLPCCEDYDVYLRLAKSYAIAPYEAIAAEYRQHGDNMTRNAPMLLKTALAVLARHHRITRTSVDWRFAYAQGRRFFSNYYGGKIVELLAEESKGRRRPGELVSLVMAGLRYDRHFTLRVAQRIVNVLRGRFWQIG
jgi:glycosyltransferase involved in cell wall biosynthesis